MTIHVARDRAEALVQELAKLGVYSPHISWWPSAEEVQIEWWHAARKMTAYVSARQTDVIKVWGANVDTEMDVVAVNDHQDVVRLTTAELVELARAFEAIAKA